MHCDRIPGGFICVSGRRSKPKPCASCGQPSRFLCDFPTGPKPERSSTAGQFDQKVDSQIRDEKALKKTTCSRPICEGCRMVVGEGIDLCPTHGREIAPPKHVEGEALQVFTGRMGLKNEPDFLDITCQGNLERCEKGRGPHRGIGIFFAPSPELLYPYMSKARFNGLTNEDGRRYAEGYVAEMRASYRRQRAAWNELLSWKRVVVLCFCHDAERCHRTILARDILTKLGAHYGGEVQS